MALGHLNTRAPCLFVAPHSKFQEQRTGDVAFGLHIGRNILQALKVKKAKLSLQGMWPSYVSVSLSAAGSLRVCGAGEGV